MVLNIYWFAALYPRVLLVIALIQQTCFCKVRLPNTDLQMSPGLIDMLLRSLVMIMMVMPRCEFVALHPAPTMYSKGGD